LALFESITSSNVSLRMKKASATRRVSKIEMDQNSQRQPTASVVTTQRIGPTAGPSRGTNVEIAKDLPRSSGLQQSTKTAKNFRHPELSCQSNHPTIRIFSQLDIGHYPINLLSWGIRLALC